MRLNLFDGLFEINIDWQSFASVAVIVIVQAFMTL